MLYWYEFVLLYFVSGFLLIGIHKLYPIIPPIDRTGWFILGGSCIALVVAWWFILKPYETYEFLVPQQKDQVLYAVLFNFPVGQIVFSYLLGRELK